MQCPQCGYMMNEFDNECPRCHDQGIQAPPPTPTTILDAAPAPSSVTPLAPLSAQPSQSVPRPATNLRWLGWLVAIVLVWRIGVGLFFNHPTPDELPTRISAPAPNSQATRSAAPAGLRPEIAAFLRAHSEFGQPTGVQHIENWAAGPRQRVDFASGRNLLFYIKNGQVVTVYEDTGNGRVIVWGKATG